MKVAVIAQYNPNMFPALHQLAAGLARSGAEVSFLTAHERVATSEANEISWTAIPKSSGLRARLPWFRSQGDFIFGYLRAAKPDWIIAQHEYLVPALAYRASLGRRSRVAAYFADYHGDRKYLRLVGRLAGFMDAYVDICDVRLGWRKRDWPRMKAETFIIRQAPYRRDNASLQAHDGPAKVVFTGSKYVLGLDRGRLARFIDRLCSHGIMIDWYLPGEADIRALARSLTSAPGFNARDPVEKSRLLQTLGAYDVGLHWAPMAEQHRDPDYFNSAASNKIGEYISAGLAVAHAGNPGLAYLPDDVGIVFDPTDPETGADQLAAELADRAGLERRRAASLRYHLDEMNFEAQAARFTMRLCTPEAPA